MKNGLVLIALFFTLAASSSFAAPASVKAVTKKSASSPSRTETYDTKPFDIHLEKLPPNYQGVNIIALCKAIDHQNPNKDQFETTSEYEQRLARIAQQALLGNILPTSPLAIVYEPQLFEVNYDADTEVYRIGVDTSPQLPYKDLPEGWSSDIMHSIEICLSGKDTGTYLGENGFGATAKVTSSSITSYAIAFPNFQSLLSGYEDPKYNFNLLIPVQVDRARAKDMQSTLRVLLIGTIKMPGHISDLGFVSATVDNPNEAEVTSNYLLFNLESIWIFDQRTGQVLKRITQ